jgi:3-hydroxybutyrate dehydrogenase
MTTNGSLVGKTALITGGGRGIGAAIAATLAADGAHVMVAARSADQVEAVAGELRGRGLRADATVCDVADPDSVEAMAETAGQHLGIVDILVNNAGIARSAPLHHLTLQEWRRIIDINVTGTFLCTKAFAPAMGQRGWGRVINIGSVLSRTGAKYVSAYAASKHAMLGFTRCIAAEMANRGVTVNAICPGYVDTEMVTNAVENIVNKTGISHDKANASILQSTPQQRLIDPDEVAQLALFLCQEAGRGINGQDLGIDGGEFMG